MTRTGKAAASPTLVWRAAADQLAHAHVLRRDSRRTLCGLPIVQHRLAWPPVARCPDCSAKAGQKAVPMGL